MTNTQQHVDYRTWRVGPADRSIAAAYRWLIAPEQARLQRRLAAVAERFPVDGQSPEDRIQEAFLEVTRSSLGRRDGAIPDAQHLERYLWSGCVRCVRDQWVDHLRERSKQPIVEQLQGVGEEAPSADIAVRVMETRGGFAEVLWSGEGALRPAPNQGRCAAAEALLEGEAALMLCSAVGRDRLRERVVVFMEGLVRRFGLAPDSARAMELLSLNRSTPYLMWRLGFGARDRRRFHQHRHRIARKLAASEFGERLSRLLGRIGRVGGVIPCVPLGGEGG